MFARYAIKQSFLSLCIGGVVFWMAASGGSGQELDGRVASNSTSGDREQPTVRYISSSQAQIFAGPSEDFYPTAVLNSGQSIEVHQETDEGWLAITPPAGSFSWLPAAQGLLLPGGRVVEVTEKSAVSWIGSSLGTAKQYRWQVKLARGQQLAVIGEQSIKDAASGSTALWYKIAPPPGEYRWIQAKATSEESPTSNSINSSSGKLASNDSRDENAGDASRNTNASLAGEQTEGSSIVDAGQVVQASARRPIASGNGPRKPRSAARPSPNQHGDPWAEWHAMEFKNGSFSFPGLSRMLGMAPSSPPASTNGARTSADPFDLTANTARPRPKTSPTMSTAPGSTASFNTQQLLEEDQAQPESSTMAVRQSRGWRDPRQLRQDRLRDRADQAESTESALVSNQPKVEEALDDEEVLDASFEDRSEVGTSVVTAGATEPRRERGAAADPISRQEQSWYGIEQAPATPLMGSTSVAQANLEELQLELSTMVAGPEATWNLAPLAERARYFIEHGQDSLQRGQARLLLERIESFAQLARNTNAVPLPAAQGVGSARALPASAVMNSANGVSGAALPSVASSPAGMNSSAGTDAAGNQFDATGWLVPVHSSGRDMPSHALTNDAGRIIVYVTPAPGVNLTRFESQAIGVYGLRGYLPQLKSNHVQIQRVVRLQ